MPKVHRTVRAERDLTAIFKYIAKDNPAAADAMLRRIDRSCRVLAENPKAGPSRDEVRPGLRSFPVGSYVVWYRPIEDGVMVLHVLHSARDIAPFF